MIPRVFHRIWVGPDPIPQAFEVYGETWRRHHPHWQIRQWTEDNLPELSRPEAYEKLRNPAERSDLLRYDLVHRFGGVYLDMDIECLRPIDELIAAVDFFVAYIEEPEPGKKTSSPRVGNSIIGAVPGHPALERAIREARPRTSFGCDKRATGPIFLENVLRDFSGITVFPREYFYPQTVKQRSIAYAVHHEARGWLTHTQMNEEIKRLNDRLRELKDSAYAQKRSNRQLRKKLRRSERRREELKKKLVAQQSGPTGRLWLRFRRLPSR